MEGGDARGRVPGLLPTGGQRLDVRDDPRGMREDRLRLAGAPAGVLAVHGTPVRAQLLAQRLLLRLLVHELLVHECLHLLLRALQLCRRPLAARRADPGREAPGCGASAEAGRPRPRVAHGGRTRRRVRRTSTMTRWFTCGPWSCATGS